MKDIVWCGDSLERLKAFSDTARREAGHELSSIQMGEEPSDWKPMKSIGQGVNEIRIHDESGAFRVIYIAKFEDAVYVLHAFQKKTRKTEKQDIELARKRLSVLRGERNG